MSERASSPLKMKLTFPRLHCIPVKSPSVESSLRRRGRGNEGSERENGEESEIGRKERGRGTEEGEREQRE